MRSRLVVVKVGTATLTTSEGKLDEKQMQKLAEQVAEAVRCGDKIVLVTSGAVAAGMEELGIPLKPNDMVFKQASAATGQSVLIDKYRVFFREHGLKVAQILLTSEDLSNRTSYLHTCNVLHMLLKLGVIPIIIENDVTSIEELQPLSTGYKVNFSDNDMLSVLVANAIDADLVVILSDVDGIYTSDPRKPDAKVMRTILNITDEFKRSLSGKSRLGRGGIQSKIQAAEIATKCGTPMVVANGRREHVLTDILAGKEVGTYFQPQNRIPAVKKWIAFGASIKGQIFVNEGAKQAILKGSSLLPVGVTEISGHFDAGDVISLVDQKNCEFARGGSNYNSGQLSLIKGSKISEVKRKLGISRPKNVIERRNIHLTEDQE